MDKEKLTDVYKRIVAGATRTELISEFGIGRLEWKTLMENEQFRNMMAFGESTPLGHIRAIEEELFRCLDARRTLFNEMTPQKRDDLDKRIANLQSRYSTFILPKSYAIQTTR